MSVGSVCAGGGAIEMEVAKHLRDHALSLYAHCTKTECPNQKK